MSIYLAIVLPLLFKGASCRNGLRASAGLIGRRLNMYIMRIEVKRPSPKDMFSQSAQHGLRRPHL